MPDTLARPLGFLSILLGVASIALLAVSVWGFRAGGWPWPQAYDLAGWGAWAAGAGVIAALAGLVVWLRRRRGGAGAVLLGLILSLPVAGLGVSFEIAARTTPPINDISTDTEDPPVFWFTATPSDYPAQNAEPQRAAYPDVRPLDMPVSADEAFTAALALVEERGWEVLSADPAESQIEAIATSRFFGFEDEVAIRVTETDTGTRIDMRSRSRLGQIDRGANARRIEAYLADLETRAPN
ncbi:MULTISPECIES: DUF1499 domain-containing protein [Roseobacteraceae]|uniref:DUF1499 domain-containing protein n=1 Tax=Marivita cryptomonadis TaxID=505252 RepID=A0A9Q2P2K2_9RHOB|nr:MULTISPECIES: DUF1499 domain-containing protein [Roseobacteraceae]MBM2323301.1 DUF1499 domain-containing protein [Marivita cryptomonadis]MBM2332886.1 DUF1499 domain-containing protein [Marivita cryptomonadis]MBM2342467.1 DUF1499 domain-containing protein [Marivita cryptomonadis]MBM2347135.1 DUF1499 domain-containing protein [Marivita cryptomonadis]MBM2351812.1 DUF1499 domain-containing protein [Marivita cryptomonadis]